MPLVGLDNHLYHLVVVVETLCAVVARLVEIVLILPARMCLGHTVEERLGAEDVEILSAHLGTLGSNAGNLCLGALNVVGDIHIGVGAQLQLAFLL